MNELVRASDADRERAVAQLREHAAQGRLTLEEFTERMSTAYVARTGDELAALLHDLPAANRPQTRRPTRFLLALFGSSEREGRVRIGRRIFCVANFGNIDLDLRQATLDHDVATIFLIVAFGTADVYVPEGVDVELTGLVVGGHRRLRGNDPMPSPGAPLVRVVVLGNFAGVDVWRVPAAWAQKSWREVIRGIRAGAHRELVP